MRDPVETTGDTVDDAIAAALEQLGATEDEVEIRVLSEGSGLPGSGDRAKVQVGFRDERSGEGLSEDERRPGPARATSRDELEAQADAAEDFLDGLLDRMDLDVDLDVVVEDDGVTVEVVGEDLGLLIGRHGSTLQALQDLTRAAIKNQTGEWPSVTVDVEGYFARRRENLTLKARSLAEKVRKSGRPAPLPPMSPNERKVVHEALARTTGVRTGSEGEGEDRHVVIYPA